MMLSFTIRSPVSLTAMVLFFFSSRRRHTRFDCDWSSDVCSSDLLFSTSEEFGEGRGLDVIPGVVRRFPSGRKVPHMGWNRVRHDGDLRLFEGIPAGAYFYFVHSYYPVVTRAASSVPAEGGQGQAHGAPGRPILRAAWCEYGTRSEEHT